MFAEPEHGSPLGKAVDRLPLSRRTSRSSLKDYNPANLNPLAGPSTVMEASPEVFEVDEAEVAVKE